MKYKKFNTMLRQAKINMMVIIGMMVAMGTMSFTAKEKAARLLSPQWFDLNILDNTDYDNHAEQEVISLGDTPLPGTDPVECAQNNTEMPCSVQLELSSGVTPQQLEGKTIKFIEDNSLAVITSAGYARLP